MLVMECVTLVTKSEEGVSPLNFLSLTVIFLPARPASQTHDSHKGRMILNHVNPAGRIKNCGEKSAFKNLQLSFLTFFFTCAPCLE